MNTCCFIGHREINETKELISQLFEIIEKLIVEENVDTFLFGSKSAFDSLCYGIVTKIKKKYPQIKRVYVRAVYPHIDGSYKNRLLTSYDDTYYPEKVAGAKKACYVKRNYEMIDKSHICVFYYSEKEAPANRKSGTKVALDYAVKKDKRIINVCTLNNINN